jgi:hypothetical protein
VFLLWACGRLRVAIKDGYGAVNGIGI